MQSSPILVFHIAGGTLGLLSGAAAMVFRKGSHRHRVTGNAFVISMLILATSGAYLGFMRHEILNGMMGVLTFYLVTTAWWTARYSASPPRALLAFTLSRSFTLMTLASLWTRHDRFRR